MTPFLVQHNPSATFSFRKVFDRKLHDNLAFANRIHNKSPAVIYLGASAMTLVPKRTCDSDEGYCALSTQYRMDVLLDRVGKKITQCV